MVAFLKKPEGSAGFHQIVDFLNSTHIKYALTENPTIYVSLIYQFWQTASASTYENGEMEIAATMDGRVKTVTEASIRRHLKLEDSDGISSLPNTKIFEQLALMGRGLLPCPIIHLSQEFTHLEVMRAIGAQTQGRHEHDLEPDFEFTAPEEVNTISPEVKTAAEKAEPVQKKTKLQLEQERLGYEEALRLQEQLDEEERQRIARVHEEANTFNLN
ncbi:hypothetical protein Tco_1146573 [Tanacetum coccineum]